MKVAVVAPSSVPFVLGGAERLWNGLVRTVNESTPHDAELIKLPTPERSVPELLASYRAWSELDLSHFDVVVSTKYPAWMVGHENHVVYLQHTLRGLYDMYPPDLAVRADDVLPELWRVLDAAAVRDDLPDVFGAFEDALREHGLDHPGFAFPGPLSRHLVHTLDRIGLAPAAVRRHLAISATVARRPGYFPPGVPVQAVHHPSDLQDFRCEGFDYFFTASRLDAPKRIALLIEAMRGVPGEVPLKIAGTGPELERLQALAAGDERVEFLGYVDTAQLLDLYANALAVPFVPFDEDLGLITLEAMMSGKPVVTATDSGGATELVAHGENGFVVPPTAEALGEAMARLAESPSLARSMGAAARRRGSEVTWERTVDAILGTGKPRLRRIERARPRNRRVVVLSTFPIHPRRGGGQLRCFHLYRALTERFDVEAVSLSGPGDAYEERALAPSFVETVVPKSAEHEAAEFDLAKTVHVPITDIAASLLIEKTPAYLEALRRAASGADAAVLAHPFLQPALALVAPGLPVVYDAHNAEFALKRTILPETRAGQRLLDVVCEVEAAAARSARLVSVCSTEDQDLLIRRYGLDPAATELVPNGVDAAAISFVTGPERVANRERWLGRYRSVSGMEELRRLAVFTGSWHLPNIDAAKHVIEIADALPHVLFALVGGHCDEFRTWWLPPNVVLLGVVSEAVKQAMLSAADVALNPMIRGSGTNLKIVEYFAAGVPVVATRLGSRGLGVEPGVHLRVAELDGLAAETEALLDDPAGAEAMAAEARRVVERDYDWRVVGRSFLERVAAELPRRVMAPVRSS